MSLPHETYIDAVIDALTAADLAPTTWWTSSDEIDPRGDGATTMDDAVLIWRDDHPAVDTVEHPDGLTLIWESSAGAWQWAELHDDGSNDDLAPLDLPLDAAPERVVEVTRGVLAPNHTLDSIAAARGITLERSGRTGADVYRDGVFVRRAARYAGESDESLLARVVRDYLHPESDPQEWAVVAEALRPKAEAEQAPTEDPADAPQDQPRPDEPEWLTTINAMSPDDMKHALVFLSGAHPNAFQAALACVERRRQERADDADGAR